MATPSDSGTVRTGLATVTVGTLFLLIATLVLVGFNFAARVLIVRSVSNASWDAFSLGFTLTQVVLAVGSVGIPVVVARCLPYAASDPERRTVVRAALVYGGLAAVASGLALGAGVALLHPALRSGELGFGLAFFGLAAGSLIAATVLASIFQGFSNVTPNALFVQIVSPGLFLGFLGLSILLPPRHVTYPAALVAYALSAAVTCAALIAYTFRRLPRPLVRGPLDAATRSRLAALVLPLFVYGAMVSVAGSGDTLVLGAIRYAQVGAYTASLTLARLVQIGISAASYIFLPVASRFLARGDRRAVRLTFVTVTKWLTVFSLPLFLLFVFLPGATLLFVFGPSYTGVVLPLQITVVGAFVGTVLGPAAAAQVAGRQSRELAINSVVAGVTDVGLALLLVPRYGDVGAAVAWASANVLYCALCLAELAAAEGYNPFGRDFLVPLAVTGAPAALLLVLLGPAIPPLLLPLLGVLLAAAFVAAILLTRSVGEGDRLLLEAVEGLLGRHLTGVRRLATAMAPARALPPRGTEAPAPTPPSAPEDAGRPR